MDKTDKTYNRVVERSNNEIRSEPHRGPGRRPNAEKERYEE